MRALIRRAKDVGAIDQDEYRNFQILFSKKGFNKNEPIMLPIEHPTLLSETLNLYKNELGYSDYDLMQIMRIGKKDYLSWFGEKPKTAQLFGCQRLSELGGEAWPTWGRGARHVRRALDVGLDFSLPFYQEKGRKKLHFIFVE